MWVDDIKTNFGQIGWIGVDWIALARDRDKWRALVNAEMNLRVPENAGNFLSGCTTVGISSSAQLHRDSTNHDFQSSLLEAGSQDLIVKFSQGEIFIWLNVKFKESTLYFSKTLWTYGIFQPDRNLAVDGFYP
jgi:hypothetical protein